MFTSREKTVMLAACWGVLDALMYGQHLGDAARGRGLKSRTLRGDAYETAFEWARDEEQDFYAALDERVVCGECGVPVEKAHGLWVHENEAEQDHGAWPKT